MIFGKQILGGFGILISNMSQVQTILSLQRTALGQDGPQKGPFWPKMPLLETLEVMGGPQRARFGPNCHQLVCLG